jgi:hypothetical protein
VGRRAGPVWFGFRDPWRRPSSVAWGGGRVGRGAPNDGQDTRCRHFLAPAHVGARRHRVEGRSKASAAPACQRGAHCISSPCAGASFPLCSLSRSSGGGDGSACGGGGACGTGGVAGVAGGAQEGEGRREAEAPCACFMVAVSQGA